jgi:hypothetical protein
LISLTYFLLGGSSPMVTIMPRYRTIVSCGIVIT